MSHCENCGTPLEHGACPNCEEELVIYEQQADAVGHLSGEFAGAVREQRIARDVREGKR